MKKLFITLSTLSLLLIAFVACNKEEPDIPFDEPIDVPFTVFSLTTLAGSPLPGTSCHWVRNSGNDVIIINSDRELRRHITCAENSNLPAIDFSKYTLLLARGTTGTVVYSTHMESLQQHSSRSYVMQVQVRTTVIDSVDAWRVAILTDKLNENANIKLNVVFPQWAN